MRHISLVFLLFFCSLALFAQEEQRTAVYKDLGGNPTLGIARYIGTPEDRKILDNIIRCCGWFQLIEDAKATEADVILQVQIASIGNGSRAYAMVQGNNKTANISVTATTTNLAACTLIDQILAKLYNNPGLCGKPIYFALGIGRGVREIYSTYLDGSGQKRITFNNAISTEPNFGGGNQLVYTLLKNHSQCIIQKDLGQGRQRVLSRAPGLNSSAGLSPDGTKLALAMSLGKWVDLYIIDLQKNQRTRLTKDRNVESSPVWSPDGSQICYVSDKNGVPQIFLLNLRNFKSIPLTQGYRETVSPDWSPVSNKICYAAKREGRYVIEVLDLTDPENVKVVTPQPGSWEAPSWAPDGRHIVCTKSRTSSSPHDLYIIDSWHCTARQLSTKADVSLPVWHP